jgi:hypothetical protein
MKTDDDFMEIDNLGLVPVKDGKFLDPNTKEVLNAEDFEDEEETSSEEDADRTS